MSGAPFLPTLIVVSGPPGTGKTTLAHALAARVGCPAICRDEIKEGMVHATPGFEAGPGDELTMRALPTFFAVVELLLRAGVTTVAEAAFQHHVWHPRLGTAPRRRWEQNPVRRAHADSPAEGEAGVRAAFSRPSLPVPSIEVDTTAGYRPGLEDILAFASGTG